MKKITAILTSILGVSLLGNAYATPLTHEDWLVEVQNACPVIWEDLGVAISAAIPPGDVWAGDTVDKDAFIAWYMAANTVSQQDAELVAGAINAVSTECAAARLGFVQLIMNKSTTDINNAMTADGGTGLNSYLSGAWQPGDVRITGRPDPAQGWVFLHGQTVGATGSGADLEGSEYMALFELAKDWSQPTAGPFVWGSDVVTLPDMRGRTIVGTSNMGGAIPDPNTEYQTAPEADTLGAVFGEFEKSLTVAEMPSHAHNIQNDGVHNHTMDTDGAHEHKLRTSVYQGSGAGRSDWKYFEGKARPNYQNTIQKGGGAVVSEGNHNHYIHDSSSHDHTMDPAGGGQAVERSQPSLVFNVEMKY